MAIGEATADQVQRFLGRFAVKILNPMSGVDTVLGMVDFGVNAGFLISDLATVSSHHPYVVPGGSEGPPIPDGTPTGCQDGDSDGACAATDCDDADPAVVICDVVRPMADTDGDCVDDAHDLCPETVRGRLVDASGCAALDWVDPCSEYPTHGAFVSLFAAVIERYVGLGLIEGPSGRYVSQAARSDIGLPPQARSSGVSCTEIRSLIDFASSTECDPVFGDGTPIPEPVGDGTGSTTELSRCLTGVEFPVTQEYLQVGAWNPTLDGVHAGIDFGTGSDVPVTAGVHGEVIRVDPDTLGLVAVYIPTEDVTVLYLHLSEVAVVRGSVVRPDTVIGSTGRVGTESAHLHVEVRRGARGYAVGEVSGVVAEITIDPTAVVDCE